MDIEWLPKKFIPRKIGTASDILFGKKISKSIKTLSLNWILISFLVASELKKLQSIISKYKFNYTVHGELSVNLMDEKYFDDHKEILKKILRSLVKLAQLI